MINKGGYLGVVVATYPAQNAVDVLLKDGSRIFAAQVQANFASSGTGVVDLPDIGLPNDDTRWNLNAAPEYYVRACVDIYDGLPIVSGFILPQVTQMTFKQKNRRIMRHASDVYSTIDGEGNIELAHPSGFFLRIATSPEHEDLTGKDVDKKWKITKNKNKNLFVRLETPEAAAQFTIAPNGDTTYNTQGTVTVTAAGDVTVNAPSVTANAELVTSNAPVTHCTGALNVDGKITGLGGMAISGGGGATVDGNMAISNGDVSADDISLKGHGHIEQGDGQRVSNSVP